MCRYTQICQNTVGGYGCICPRGYRSQGIGFPCLGTAATTSLTIINIFSNFPTRNSYVLHLWMAGNWSHSVFQTLTNVSRVQTLVPTSAGTSPAASGVCVLRGRCFSETDAPAQAWRGAPSSAMLPESGRDSALSWCPLWQDQSCPGLRGRPASPGRVVR